MVGAHATTRAGFVAAALRSARAPPRGARDPRRGPRRVPGAGPGSTDGRTGPPRRCRWASSARCRWPGRCAASRGCCCSTSRRPGCARPSGNALAELIGQLRADGLTDAAGRARRRVRHAAGRPGHRARPGPGHRRGHRRRGPRGPARGRRLPRYRGAGSARETVDRRDRRWWCATARPPRWTGSTSRRRRRDGRADRRQRRRQVHAGQHARPGIVRPAAGQVTGPRPAGVRCPRAGRCSATSPSTTTCGSAAGATAGAAGTPRAIYELLPDLVPAAAPPGRARSPAASSRWWRSAGR